MTDPDVIVPEVVDGTIHPDLANLAQPLASLTMLDPNPNVGDVEAVMRSYAQFGQRKPIVVRQSDRVIIAGNTSYMAATNLGWPSIACVLVDDDEATSLAFALADNHTADLGTEDKDALVWALQRVQDSGIAELLAAASYTSKDIDALLKAGEPGDTSPQLEQHYQVLVDCTDEDHQRRLIDEFVAAGHTVRALTV